MVISKKKRSSLQFDFAFLIFNREIVLNCPCQKNLILPKEFLVFVQKIDRASKKSARAINLPSFISIYCFFGIEPIQLMYWFSVIKRLPYIRPHVARAPLKCGPQSIAIIVTTLNNTSKCYFYFKFNKSLTFDYTFWEIAARTY